MGKLFAMDLYSKYGRSKLTLRQKYLCHLNFDVPDHSIVIGNPGKIIHKENATEGYIRIKA